MVDPSPPIPSFDAAAAAAVAKKDGTPFEQTHGATHEAVDIYRGARLGKNKYAVADAK